MNNRTIVVDSSSLITISNNCFIKILKHLSELEKMEFVIPESVYQESVKRPVAIKRFELNAIRIRDAVEEGYIKVMKTTPELKNETQRIQDISSKVAQINSHNLTLVDLGEAETLALMRKINSNILLIDERTTRMLIEEPENLAETLSRRHHGNVRINENIAREFRKEFRDVKIIRSVELMAFAYETGAFAKELHKSKQALEAMLFASKFAGCAVSFNEITEFLKKVKQ